MSKKKRNKLIIRGETLAEIPKYERVSPPFKKHYEKGLEEAQEILLSDLTRLKHIINETDDELKLPEYYFKVTLPQTFKARSYKIDSLYNRSNVTKVGSFAENISENNIGTSDIVKGTEQEISDMVGLVTTPDTNVLKKEIRRIEKISDIDPIISEFSTDKTKHYELSFYGVSKEFQSQLLEKIQNIIGYNFKYVWIPNDDNFILYINTDISQAAFEKLSKFNVLRSAQEIYNKHSMQERTSVYNNIQINKETNGHINIGMIDGGVDTRSDYFRSVEELYSVSAPPSKYYQSHGNSVASTILYGDLSKMDNNQDTILTSEYKLTSVRGMPSNEDESFNLIDLEKIIHESIPKYPNVKIWNLSLGPAVPMIDENISSFTYLLDTLAYKYDVIFVIAVGNTGRKQGFLKRIQIPADSVNNISVSAYYTDKQNNKEVAPYSSIGPGREGAKLKPDYIDNGGLIPISPVRVFDGEYSILSDSGTSFSAPLVARKLARLSTLFPEMDSTQIRALAEHSVVINKNYDNNQLSFTSKGELSNDISTYISSDESEVRISYNGVISAKGVVELPIPIPDNIISKKVKFTWTLAVKTPVNIESPDKYTQYCIEDKFIPNEKTYRFYNDSGNSRIANEEDEEKILTLTNEGYTKRSKNPVTDSATLLNEQDLIDEELKWDTIKNRTITKMTTGLKKPYIRLHGLSRDDDDRNQFEYALVLTMKFRDDIEVHSKILEENKSLREISIQNEIIDNIQIDI